MIDYVEELSDRAKDLGLDSVCGKYLYSDDFGIWTGSGKSFHHHYGDGGLARHTCEVVDLCFLVDTYYSNTSFHHECNQEELFLAAFFHDLGKLHDFERVGGVWVKSSHARYIHHISRSAAIWTEESRKYHRIYNEHYESVLHAILAHHGGRTHGSPVAPKSRVAWLVHLCDGISARYDDADRLDVIHGEV